MREILNDIIYLCGAIFLCYIGCAIIVMIGIKIREITYDAHQNLMELSNLKRKHKQAREEIWEKVQEYSGSGNEVTQAYCDGFKASLAIIDKLIESEEVNEKENQQIN